VYIVPEGPVYCIVLTGYRWIRLRLEAERERERERSENKRGEEKDGQMGKLLGRRDRIINVARLCPIQIYELCSRVAYEDLPLVYTNVQPICVHCIFVCDN